MCATVCTRALCVLCVLGELSQLWDSVSTCRLKSISSVKRLKIRGRRKEGLAKIVWSSWDCRNRTLRGRVVQVSSTIIQLSSLKPPEYQYGIERAPCIGKAWAQEDGASGCVAFIQGSEFVTESSVIQRGAFGNDTRNNLHDLVDTVSDTRSKVGIRLTILIACLANAGTTKFRAQSALFHEQEVARQAKMKGEGYPSQEASGASIRSSYTWNSLNAFGQLSQRSTDSIVVSDNEVRGFKVKTKHCVERDYACRAGVSVD
ncbi:hypothetical protein EDB19DRAFT_1828720 [Suillus lakei]|nr:hypothetical protein EDB19DRAFT_1828720 [Suillus lakei]